MIIPPQGSESVRVALVGCGAIGELVARHVYANATGGFRLVAAIDRPVARRWAPGSPTASDR